MHKFELEEWDFDSTTDLAPSTPEVGMLSICIDRLLRRATASVSQYCTFPVQGLYNHAKAGSLLGALEVFMEDIIAGAGEHDMS